IERAIGAVGEGHGDLLRPGRHDREGPEDPDGAREHPRGAAKAAVGGTESDERRFTIDSHRIVRRLYLIENDHPGGTDASQRSPVNAGGALPGPGGRRVAVVAEHPVPAFRLTGDSRFIVSVALHAPATLTDYTCDERECVGGRDSAVTNSHHSWAV